MHAHFAHSIKRGCCVNQAFPTNLLCFFGPLGSLGHVDYTILRVDGIKVQMECFLRTMRAENIVNIQGGGFHRALERWLCVLPTPRASVRQSAGETCAG